MANTPEIAYPHREELREFAEPLAGLVLGLVSLVGGFVAIVGLVCGVGGLYFSILGRARTMHHAAASAGLVLSIIGTVIGAVITTWWLIAGTMGFGWTIAAHSGWMRVFA
jgi:hypothetical protein